MYFTECPKSASILSPFLSHNNTILEPIDSSTPPVLDLCTRPKTRSPNPEGARQPIKSSESSHCCPSPIEFSSIEHEDSTKWCTTQKTKITRPFKAYPKDPYFLAIGASTADVLLGQESAEAYSEFRKKMLLQVHAINPQPGVLNAKMRRSNIPTSTQDFDGKDPSYWEKRRKNNEAAKRSRDARRAKEDEIAIRAAFLEQENLKLKYEVAALRNETAKLRCLLYN